MEKKAVFAVGGNALIKDKDHQTVEDQYRTAGETAVHIAQMICEGWEVVVTHGTGPQIGFILRRSELAREELHEVPLDVCDADAQGGIGYALQQNLQNVLRRMGMPKTVVTLITQTEVRLDDPAFSKPTKGIGELMSKEKALAHTRSDGWAVSEEAGRGWRRVVASPRPLRIVEVEAIRAMLASGIVTIAGGGGGIPVAADARGELHGVGAVIDKDLTAALMATEVGAKLLIITTSVEKVALNWGKPEQKWIDRMSLLEAREYLAEGVHFAAESMGPKIQAVINFLEAGGESAIITNPENAGRALRGNAGTHILR